MPVYNSVDTVKKSIVSFKKLSEISNFICRLFIVDDCSADQSNIMIDEIIKSNENIDLIQNKKNIGPGLSRNKALEKIRSGYVGFLDSDDVIIPENYVKSFNSGSSMKADWITFNGWTESNDVRNEKYDFDRIVDNTKKLTKKCVRGELDGSVIFSIFSLRLINDNAIRFPAGYYEDIPFIYTAMILAKKRCISNEYSYNKINRSGSIVNTISKKHIDGLLDSCVSIKRNFMNRNLSNYKEFESDFIFGAYGYLATALIKILTHNISSKSKIELLNYLYEKKNKFLELRNLPIRTETKKDLLTSFFINNYEQQKINKDLLLEELYQRYNQLFKGLNG